MGTTDYVSYELAVKLKAAGFDEPCLTFYDANKELGRALDSDNFNHLGETYQGEWFTDTISAPTLWQAQKWLREKKGIAINVIAHGCHDKYREGKYHWEEIHLPNSNENGPQWIDWFIYGKHPLFDTYEEALSDGLDKMLDLLAGKEVGE